jgi:hypothetical protein
MMGIISNAVQVPTQNRRAQIESEVDAFFASVATTVEEFEVIVPIYNLKISNNFKVGDVRFEKFSKHQEKKCMDILKEVLRANRHYDEAAKKRMSVLYEERFIKPLRNSTYAKTGIKASEKRANEIALRKINEAIDIVRLFCLANEGPHGSNTGLKGEVLERTSRNVIKYSTSKKGFYPTLEQMGPLYEQEIDATLLKTMKKYGLNKLNTILLKKDRNWIERKIIRAIYWFSRIFDTPLQRIDDEKILAMRERQSEKTEEIFEYGRINDRLVKTIIALESLLTLDNREAVQNNIAERTAFILGKDFKTRKSIKRFIKDVYGYRSETVHNGFTYVSKSELNQLIELVRSAIITMILRKDRLQLKSKQDLREYFEKLKFS